MALGAMTKSDGQSVNVSKAAYFDAVSFAGDDAYPTGGTTGFDALLQALGVDARNVIGVIAGDCGGFVPVYLPANGGTLKVFTSNGASPAALAEAPNATDLSGTTFNLIVVSK